MSRTASNDSGGHDAEEKNRPGSCELSDPANADVANFDSTNALYSRPFGDWEMMPPKRFSGAQSSCDADGTWYATPTDATEPTRRKVTVRSPSCAGSSV